MTDTENYSQQELLPDPARKIGTKAEYARHRGCAPSAVTRALKEGRISTVIINGREMVDFEASDRRWATLTRPKADAPTGPQQRPDRSEEEPEGDKYKAAKTREAEASAALRELELQRRRGELVPLADVVQDLTTAVGIILNAWHGLPARMAPVLADQPQDRIHALLAEAVTDIQAATHAALEKAVRESQAEPQAE
ncbi:hypothetical protein [uncultured Thiohalocapsa sp.]|uniref:hypothetical protein n=1 Tax=uncultured Thiohalocapsa sp. TaxID=768990 RepID=UPI0025DCAF36|nr:hypothetical protein [uncultured Thiohalocapsa sp.]